MTSEREFYVGYQAKVPGDLARFLRRAVVLLVMFAAAVAATLAVAQGRFDPGVWEYGVVRSFEGVIRESPHPVLLVEGPGTAENQNRRPLLLVAVGKRGAGAEIAGFDGQPVKLNGSLIYREGETMIEVVGGSVEPLGEARLGLRAESTDLGIRTLRGEIVDSKCFLGVMKPGRGKPHRGCASRCISGGVPPVLRVETRSGDYWHYLVVDENGTAVNDRVLEYVAEPIEITGRVIRRDSLLYIQADPETYRRTGRG
ncbi:MAG: hypothetical protein GY769_15550 [bacterium]|nr:hypothetical protein [bacterium]